ncbi:TolC family protein [Campylobacter sp. RM9344]|uniref:TolC family protein n=1 Tax=Campylobacter californiensis TaxID=1032243 RepID=A0AAW3ZVK7_9BACT|nr:MULTISPECIES: TolC family protein [unclassified Campylobacter]MBE2984248.1 TolC family protein [Campylobacter sp. RM6883]MBE2985997.1 TolC family protein [Campylobacter sp. RM12919]MBE2988323.1 TolC family protein [Campylobacter sp. RM12920]MBE2994885.1 TolC family protein [Campylobacter sp. RM6913]MBE3029477.1 TolC family protein [Campylobacter sp. RM9344]
MRILSLALVAVLSGCAVKDVNENFSEILLQNENRADVSINTKWWQEYNKNYLNELIELGIKNNIDLAKAAVAINKAMAQAGVLEAELIPTFNASVEVERSRDISTNSSWTRTNASGISLNYEIDLFRKLANARDAALWEARATRFDLEASKLSVINGIVDGYFNIAYLNESIRYYKILLDNYEKLQQIVLVKFQSGKEEELSLTKLQNSVISTKTRLLNAQNELLTIEKNIKILLNVKPGFELKTDEILISDIIPIGVDLEIPLESISTRPDLQAAIFRIEEGLLNLKASQKDFYPSITIGASLRGSDENFSDSFSMKFLSGNVSLNLPFLNYSKLKSNLKISEANFESAKLNYLSTLNTALNEISTSYKSYEKDTRVFDNYVKQFDNTQKISEIYNNKYQYGKAELKDYLEALNDQTDAYINLLSGKYNLLQDEIEIYQAMAGKFTKR